jgi:hypothetical protein
MATTTRGRRTAEPRSKTTPVPDDNEPKGMPTSERFAAEAAHHDIDATGQTDQIAPTERLRKPPVPSRTTSASSAEAAAKPTSEAVRQEAYAIWIAEGHPHGREHAHWHEAERRLANRLPRK